VIPELCRPFPVSRASQGASFLVQATEAERRALAARMDLPAIAALSCEWVLRPDGKAAFYAEGKLRSSITQVCVVTLEPFPVEVAEDFSVRFVPEGEESEEIDLEAVDEVPYSGASIDLGEATCEQLALALDPFPRAPGVADAVEPQGEDPSGAFAPLARIRRPQ
jgi:uncharacterized metal-binding protein YceD (DUF177 family)